MYYLVTALRGHNGKGKSVDITFAFKAGSALAAVAAAKKMPAVKHSKGVLAVREIEYDEYMWRLEAGAYNQHLTQKGIDNAGRVCYNKVKK